MTLLVKVLASTAGALGVGAGEIIVGVLTVGRDVGVTCVGAADGWIDVGVTAGLPHPAKSRANNTTLNTC